MNTLRERARISFLPLLMAAVMLLLAIGIMLAQNQGGAASTGGAIGELTTHQDGDPPPRCRPAGKYASQPHPNDPACKHKPEKHN